MEHRIDETLSEPLDDEEQILMDPETWDWDTAEELEPVANPGIVVAVRLSLEEVGPIERAARAEGATLNEFLKRSALARAMHRAPS